MVKSAALEEWGLTRVCYTRRTCRGTTMKQNNQIYFDLKAELNCELYFLIMHIYHLEILYYNVSMKWYICINVHKLILRIIFSVFLWILWTKKMIFQDNINFVVFKNKIVIFIYEHSGVIHRYTTVPTVLWRFP